MIEKRPLALRYATPIGVVAIALAIAWGIPSPADPSHFSFFFFAVMASAWYGGFGPGILATFLAASCLDYFFIAPIYSIDMDWRALLRLSVFMIVAGITSYLTTARKRAEQALREAHANLESRVQERTAELARANESLHAQIAERKRAETELWRLEQEMGRVERLAALGKMAAAIAHELGTPLNSVLGYTQLLGQESFSESGRRRLGIVEAQVKRMKGIIEHYLSRTRGRTQNRPIDTRELVKDTLILLDPIFQQHQVTVSTNLPESIPVVCGDEASLQRVLVNVLDNAVGAMDGRGLINIDVRTTGVLNDKRDAVVIEITDTGAGIPPELLPKIFDLFVSSKPSGKGTGLGLAVSQEIVKAHAGKIDIASEVGRGTAVRILLPADQDSEILAEADESR